MNKETIIAIGNQLTRDYRIATTDEEKQVVYDKFLDEMLDYNIAKSKLEVTIKHQFYNYDLLSLGYSEPTKPYQYLEFIAIEDSSSYLNDLLVEILGNV